MTAIATRSRFSLTTEWLALTMLVVCSFVVPISVTATTITFLLAWVLILASGNWRARLQKIIHNPAALSFWVLFALFLVGLIYTISPQHLAFKDLQKRHWLLIAPFFMMVINNDRWRERMINAFLIIMVITLFLSYLKWMKLDLVNYIIHKKLSGVGVFFEHIVQYFFMSVAAFIFGYRFFYRPKWRWVNLSVLILMAINLAFLSQGRTGYIQFGLLLVFLCFIRFGWKGILSAFAISVLLFGAAFTLSNGVAKRIRAIPAEYQHYDNANAMTPIGIRISMWHDAMLLIKKRPWFGYGTGNISTAMKQNLPPAMIKLTGPIDYVEYSYLNFMLEFGVFGLFTFLGVIITQIIISFRLPTEYKYTMQAFLIAYLAGSLANSFFVSFCEVHLYAIFSAVCFSALAPSTATITKSSDQLAYENT